MSKHTANTLPTATLSDLLPDLETPTSRPDKFYAWRLAKLKAIYEKRSAGRSQKMPLVK